MRARGADFSAYQSIGHVDAVAQQIDFGLVKATQGTGYVNPQLNGQVTVLRRHKKIVGVYHFLTSDDPVAQWDHFETVIRPLGIYLVAVDHERGAGADPIPADHIAQAFIRRGRQRGYKVGRYGSSGVTMNRGLGEAWRWVAAYQPAPPAVAWHVWQFSDGNGAQDWDVFHGDAAQLARFVATLKPKPAPPPARWWLRDVAGNRTLGPYRLARLVPALAAYSVRHPKVSAYTLRRA